MKTSIVVIAIAILLALMVGSVGAKDIVVSNGISLSDTADNRTVELKQVVTDLKMAPASLATKAPSTDIVSKGMETLGLKQTIDETTTEIVEGEITYSMSPVSKALLGIAEPEKRAAYKAEYIAKYSDLVGSQKISMGGHKIVLFIKDVNYNSDTDMLVLNLSASVDGQEKLIHNPYKIYNPPVMVQVSPNTGTGRDMVRGEFVESSDSAIIQSVAQNIQNFPNGEATFGDPDPTVVIYATETMSGYGGSVGRDTPTDNFLQLIAGEGNIYYPDDGFLYTEVYGDGVDFGVSRSPMSFNTASLSGMYILDSSITVTSDYSIDELGITPSLSFTRFTSADTSDYQYADYQTNGTASTRYGTDIPYASFTNGLNKLSFSANGKNQINKAGYTQIMARLSQDTDSISVSKPVSSLSSLFSFYSSNASGTANDPYMTVTYSPDAGYSIPSDFSATPLITGTSVPVTFTPTNLSTSFGFNWSFGDGTWSNISTATSPQHIYSTSGLYTPSLYRYNTTSHLLANSTTKIDYIGINRARLIPTTSGTPERYPVSETYSQIFTGAGTTTYPGLNAYISSNTVASRYEDSARGIIVFDTSIIPPDYVISSATLNATSTSSSNGLSNPLSMMWSGASPTSTSSIVASDYNKNGTVVFTDAIAQTSIPGDASTPTRWTLNANGISSINTAGKTPFMLRTSWDIYSSDPGWVSNSVGGIDILPETAPVGYKPSLDLVFSITTPSDFTVSNPVTISGQSITFNPLSTVLTGITYNWSFGDGSWTNVSNHDPVTHTYSSTNIYTPALYIMSGTTVVNSTIKSEYIGINSMKYYPSTDGYVSRTTAAAWSTIRTGAGTAVDSTATSAYARQSATSSASTYNTFDRLIQIYDVKGNTIPASATITNASLNFYGNAHSSTFSTNPNFVATNVSALSSLDSITSSDFNKYGNTPLSSSNISYASYTDGGYNRMYLNAAGIGIIDRTTLKTPFMLRTSWDVDNLPPTWSTTKTAYFRPLTNESATNRPFLLVNFTASPVYFTVNSTVGIIGASTFQFNDTSPSDGGTYNWSFGDGTYSAIRNATHTYTSQGLFTVTYTTPIGGSYLTQTNLINISAPSFYCDAPLTGGLPFTVTCHDTSAVLTGDTHWIWGDGTSFDDGTDVSHTYTVVGNYDVQLQTPSATGDIVTITNYIHAGIFTPVTDFTSNVTSVAAGGYVSFTDLSTNTPTSWKWDFDGGTSSDSTLQNPVYQYNTVGNYTVNETAINGAGYNSLIKSNYIRVYPAGWTPGMVPITAATVALAGSNYSYGNQGYNPLFLSTVTGTSPYTYAWNFGDGGTSTAAQPQHAFNTVGTFPVQLTVSNPISSYTTNLSTNMVIYGVGIPYANFIGQPTAGTPGVLVSFKDLSLHGNTTGQTCNWSFGDSTYSLTPTSSICGDVAHVYGYAGVYDVNYSITNFNGSSYMLRQQYIVVSTNQQTQTTFYSPHQVAIQVLDANHVPIVNTMVTANAIESTLPGGLSGALSTLQASYGIPLAEAQQMLDSATIYSGHTDSNGYVAVLMLSTINYEVSAIDTSGVPYNVTLMPEGVYYQMDTLNATTLNMFSQAAISNQHLADSVYISNFTEPNTSYGTMSNYVYDASGQTTGANCWWKLVDNGTVWWDNRSWALGSGLQKFSKTVPHVMYQQWKWGCSTT